MFDFVYSSEETALVKGRDKGNNYSKEDGEYVPVSNADIDRIEKRFGIVFPDVLRKYYLKHNAKWIHSTEIDTPDGDKRCIADILPIINTPVNRWGIENEYSVECIKANEISEPEEYGCPLRVRNNFIPLAGDQGSGTYYWDSTNGKVYVSFNADEDENGLEIPYYICPSVEEMFGLMDRAYNRRGCPPAF